MDKLNKREKIATTLITIALAILLCSLELKLIQYCVLQIFGTYLSVEHTILLVLLARLLFNTFTINIKGD